MKPTSDGDLRPCIISQHQQPNWIILLELKLIFWLYFCVKVWWVPTPTERITEPRQVAAGFSLLQSEVRCRPTQIPSPHCLANQEPRRHQRNQLQTLRNLRPGRRNFIKFFFYSIKISSLNKMYKIKIFVVKKIVFTQTLLIFLFSIDGHLIKGSIEFPYIPQLLIRNGHNAILNKIIVKASIVYNTPGSFWQCRSVKRVQRSLENTESVWHHHIV